MFSVTSEKAILREAVVFMFRECLNACICIVRDWHIKVLNRLCSITFCRIKPKLVSFRVQAL